MGIVLSNRRWFDRFEEFQQGLVIWSYRLFGISPLQQFHAHCHVRGHSRRRQDSFGDWRYCGAAGPTRGNWSLQVQRRRLRLRSKRWRSESVHARRERVHSSVSIPVAISQPVALSESTAAGVNEVVDQEHLQRHPDL